VPSTPLVVSVTSDSPSSITLYNGDCATVTWTTNISGGAAPYTTAMFRNSVSVGSARTYSQTYCGNGLASTKTITVSATVNDSGGQTGSGSQTTTVRSIADSTGCTSGTRICQIQ
jgi:hypothetical protein